MDNNKPDPTNPPGEINPESPAAGAPAGEEDFARMFAASLQPTGEGQVIHGKVIKVLKDFVAVDINKKSEGMLPLEDLPEEERGALNPGDPIEVMTEGYDTNLGAIRLSRSKVMKIRVWDDLQKAFDEGTAVQGAIVAKVKGGYTVDIGVKAFLPGSQVDLRPVRDTDPVIGISGKFKILKFSRKKANVVVSRRAFMEEEREVQRSGLLDHIKEGDIVEARVKNITDYGVFMDLGGLDGLMHVTDMSYGKVGHPSDLCKVGELYKVRVIRFDRERGRISLGLKQTKSDPWLDLDAKYQPGMRVRGKVTNTTKYGAFIDVEEQAAEGPVRGDEGGRRRRGGGPEGRQIQQEDLPGVQTAPLEPVGRASGAAPRRFDRRGGGEERGRFRRLRRCRGRHRRPGPRFRPFLEHAGEEPVRDVPEGGPGPGDGPQDRPRGPEVLPRHQAARRGSVGGDREAVPEGRHRHGEGDARGRLRGVRRDRRRGRGAGPRLRDLPGEDRESGGGAQARRRGGRGRPRRRPVEQESLPQHPGAR